jgi:hypothetical protein
MSKIAYPQFGGVHPETATITNILASQGVKNPYTNTPLSEAMVMGIGGGLGIGYLLFEFTSVQPPLVSVVIAFSNRWNYTIDYMNSLFARLGISISYSEATSPKKAWKNLHDQLDAGQPAFAWIDLAFMPYAHKPAHQQGHLSHWVTIFGYEDDFYWVDDKALRPFKVPKDALEASRGRISSYKNRLLKIESIPTAIDLPQAILAGIADHIEHLSKDSETFSLPVLKKWAKTINHPKDKKSWRVVYGKKGRAGLYDTLWGMYEYIMQTKGGLRGMYADFLAEAGPIIGKNFAPAIGQYRKLADHWLDFAEILLPDTFEDFSVTKDLLQEKNAHLLEMGGDADITPYVAQLTALDAQHNADFPLSDEEVDALFEAMRAKLLVIYEAETTALETLKEIMS